ncbi:TetR family transcriptional regulator [Nocardia puris]|uniref:TetR/AcrR family transcriptional regulator n=1 Tax=Nocardia puris TaxID=208602 RepID=UPI001893B23E|nr:TetR family transcriptional regulator [Nocardia puris]MBF6209483.1 TetR family transcriptional regulator [Nocardia puris]MBF6367848.1 TetR family transcriptional regulator [Nocardia puris]MBF6458603.1 TetR family transcriptional regulator [Nocardia puris]
MANPARRKRDPEGRRALLIATAAELIVEVGADALTHRLVAARAGVPLGSTTQYFATLDDLRQAALHHLATDIDGGLARFRDALAAEGDPLAAVAEAVHAAVRDSKVLAADVAVTTAAMTDPELRALSLRWFDELVALLTPRIGARRAVAVAVYVDGATWHAVLHEEPLTLADITDTLAALFAGATPDEEPRP